MRKIITLSTTAILLIAFMIEASASSTELCDTISSQTPCKGTTEWQKSELFKPFILQPVDAEAAPEKIKSQAIVFLAQRLRNAGVQPLLLALLKELTPEQGAGCVANKLVSYAFLLPDSKIFVCPEMIQKQVNRYFDEPNENTRADFSLLTEIITIFRPAISGEIDYRMASYTEELKQELLSYLAAKQAPQKYLDIVKAIRYVPSAMTACRQFKGNKREQISLEMIREVHVCQAAVSRPISLFTMIWTVAHEIGHSLDACELSLYGIRKFPKSTKKLEVMLKNHPVRELYETALNKLVDAKDWSGADSVCDFANLHEAFADIVASVIAPPVIERAMLTAGEDIAESWRLGYLSVGARICRIENLPDLDSIPPFSRHPLGNSRLKYLLGTANAQKQLRCKAGR